MNNANIKKRAILNSADLQMTMHNLMISLPYVYQKGEHTVSGDERETEIFESIHLRARVTFSVLGGV